jgi:hypothetical protein
VREQGFASCSPCPFMRSFSARICVSVTLGPVLACGAHGADSGSDGGPRTLLLIAAASATSASQRTVGFSYDASTDTWSPGTVLGDATHGGIDGQNGSVALAFTDSNDAVAVLTDATDASGVSGPVQFATWGSGTWARFTSIGSTIKASSAPSLTLGDSSLQVAFASDTGHDESAVSFARSIWSAPTAVGSFTGGPPSVAARSTGLTVLYVRSSDGALVAVDETSGTWGAEQLVVPGGDSASPNAAIAPTLVALGGSGPELLVVYTDRSATDLHSTTRAGGTWSSIQDFNLEKKVINPDPTSDGSDGPSPSFATPVLPMPGGNAVLAFTSVSQHVYTSQFDGAKWSTAASLFTPWCLDCIDVAQAGLALGVGSATFEVVFGGDPTSQNAYVPYHTRFVDGRWTTPKPVGAKTTGLFTTYALGSI